VTAIGIIQRIGNAFRQFRQGHIDPGVARVAAGGDVDGAGRDPPVIVPIEPPAIPSPRRRFLKVILQKLDIDIIMDPADGFSFSGAWERTLFKKIINELDQESQKFIEEHPDTISEAYNQTVPIFTKNVYETLKRNAPDMIAYERERRFSFAADNYKIWKKSFDLLEMHLRGSCEIIGEYIAEVGPLFENNERSLFTAITALHGNGCHVAQEIFALMQAGYASGALARWRKLFEIEVMAYYLKENGRGSGNDLAQRYLDHSVIDKYQRIQLYARPEVLEDHSRKLGYMPIDKEDIDKLKALSEKLCKKYGSGYSGKYGWASSSLKKNKVEFVDLERAVGLGHFYPYYQLANNAVHSGSGSIFWNISLPLHSRDAILIGPTWFGMADPGQLLAISLSNLNCILLSLHPSLTAQAIMQINIWLSDEITEELIKVHRVQNAAKNNEE
jgi:hypothetical protein